MESSFTTQLWINLETEEDQSNFRPLTGCHTLDDLDQPINEMSDCEIGLSEQLAVPTRQAIYIKDNEEFVLIKPEMSPPTESNQLLISEVMWPGSFNGTVSWAYDEWLELYNPTTRTLDLSGVEIRNAGFSGASLYIPAGKYLPPLSYFIIGAREGDLTLLARDPDWVTNKLSLSNYFAGLSIFSSTGIKLDALPIGTWQAGINNLTDRQRSSAQRKSANSPGDDWLNWTDCAVESLLPNFAFNWKPESGEHNCGSPWEATIFSVE